MKRTLALTAATVALALSLAACGAGRNMSNEDRFTEGSSATDTLRNRDGESGTGTSSGASVNQNTITDGLGSVSGAINRGRESLERGLADLDDRDTRDFGALDSSAYSASYQRGTMQARTATGSRLDRMLENARVHDSDGFLLDGENSSWDTL